MASVVSKSAAGGHDWMRIAAAGPRLERVEAFFRGHGFDPHQHDTYAVGFTVEGVQSFQYRGKAEYCMLGHVFVLHPDERHDGRAGTTTGFRFRTLYVRPTAIRDTFEDPRRPLPFVRDAVSRNLRIAAAIAPALDDLNAPLDDLEIDEIVLELAHALVECDRAARSQTLSRYDRRAVNRVRDFLDANIESPVSSTQLERVSGLTRYAVARHFRACLGTSPYRYLVLRRLDRACSLIERNIPLADVANLCCFSDQSHLTRHFKNTFGIPPGRWTKLRTVARITTAENE